MCAGTVSAVTPGVLTDVAPEPVEEQPKREYLMWVDLETTGLNVSNCQIIEIAAVMTNMRGDLIYQGMDFIINDLHLQWEQGAYDMHKASGLLDEYNEVKGGVSVRDAELYLTDFAFPFGFDEGDYDVYLAGSTVYFDRAFLMKYFPNFVHRLHYRMLDVSTLKIVASSFGFEVPEKKEKHRAMEDVSESIENYRHYVREFNLDGLNPLREGWRP